MLEFSKTLGELQKIYVPGMAAHFDRHSPNPWQALHNSIEAAYKIGDATVFESVCEKAITTAKRLADEYKKSTDCGKGPVDDRDAFYSGDPERFSRAKSTREKKCMYCGCFERGKLKLKRYNDDVLDLYLICKDCLEKKK